MTTIHDSDATAIGELLLGRRIVDAGERTINEGWRAWQVTYLLLDNGTELHIKPNEGCGGCSSGHYWVNAVAAFPNVITSVTQREEPADGDYDDERLTITVYAEGASETVVSVSGSEGNGYYGRGYTIEVMKP